MIMDEPTNNLGVPEQQKVLELIRRLRDQGVPVILITHILPDAFAVTDRVIVMHRGRKVAEKATTSDDHAEELVQYMVGARDDAWRRDRLAQTALLLLEAEGPRSPPPREISVFEDCHREFV